MTQSPAKAADAVSSAEHRASLERCLMNDWKRCKACPKSWGGDTGDSCFKDGHCHLSGQKPSELSRPPPVHAHDSVTEAVDAIVTQRDAQYGSPKESFRLIADLKSLVAACPDPVARHALDMICVKVARLVRNPKHRDSWSDIAGYARAGAMVTERSE